MDIQNNQPFGEWCERPDYLYRDIRKRTSQPDKFWNYANFVVNNLNREAGGIGAYHINADSFDKNEYRYVRNAISIMNPPIK